MDLECQNPIENSNFLWQLFHNVVLTRDVMKHQGWKGNPKCSFCEGRETSHHLFFTCPVARVTWRTVACMFGTALCPDNIWQAYVWCYTFFPGGENFYTAGIAVVCWAIWSCRNRATFEFKPLTNPFECIFFCLCLNVLLGRTAEAR